MILTSNQLKSQNHEIWGLLSSYFSTASNLPCLFAMASFKKAIMNFLIVNSYDDIINNFSENIINFNAMCESMSFHDKTYKTLLIVSSDINLTGIDESEFIGNLLADLALIDKIAWPDGKTKNMDDQDFEFYWGGHSWFPILLHKHHKETVRRSPLFMLGFQPGDTFNFNKSERPDFYIAMRKAIHRRIHDVYRDDVPFYLSDASSGRNICQYSGCDKKEFNSHYEYGYIKTK